MVKKVYVGIDLLKFIMALMIVAIHVDPFAKNIWLSNIFQPLKDIAVPVFFIISSFLLFSKDNLGWEGLFHFAKRILVLYCVWFLIDFPYILSNKVYFNLHEFPNSIILLLKDLFLSYTFPGSWFLSALVVSVFIVFVLSKSIGRWCTFILSLSLSLYIYLHSILPDNMLTIYKWYALHVREEVYLSFPFALVWVSIGQILAKKPLINMSFISLSQKRNYLFLCGGVAIYIFYVLTNNLISLSVLKYLLAIFVFLLFKDMPIPAKPLFRWMRNCSIIMYLFHFALAGKKSLFLSVINKEGLAWDLSFYFLVVLLSLLFASIILLLERNKYFRFLKYTH